MAYHGTARLEGFRVRSAARLQLGQRSATPIVRGPLLSFLRDCGVRNTVTNSYSDKELNEMRISLESDLVERKRSASDGNRIRRNICALANDLPGHGRPGVILIGVEDDGSCADIKVTDRLLRDLAGMRDDGNIIPLPSLTVQKRRLGGCEVAVLLVDPSWSPPVRYKGRVWVRVGPTARHATPQEEQRLAERRRRGIYRSTRDPLPKLVSTISTWITYSNSTSLVLWLTRYWIRTAGRSENQLRSLRLLTRDIPTWGALLGLSPDPLGWIPGAYVQVLRIDGTVITDPILANNRLRGRLEDVLRRMIELLQLNVRTRVGLAADLTETRSPDFPLVALQQLALNAVMHRTYEGTNAPVRVNWYNDRIEFISPGGLYGQVNPENFGRGATDYRNPLVAEIMHNLGFAQRFGMGLPLARQALERNGNPPPNFGLTSTHVVATVKAAP